MTRHEWAAVNAQAVMKPPVSGAVTEDTWQKPKSKDHLILIRGVVLQKEHLVMGRGESVEREETPTQSETKETLARLDDQIFFLGRVIARTTRGRLKQNPKYIRDVIAVLGLQDSGPGATSCVKRTPTTESLVEQENEKRVVYKTAVGKTVLLVPRAC